MNHDLRPSCARWGDIVLLSLTAAAVTAVLAAFFLRTGRAVALARGLVIPGGVLLALMALPWAWRHRRACFGVRNLLRYPPAWVAALPGFGFLVLLWSLDPASFAASGGIQAGWREILAASRPWLVGVVGGILLLVAVRLLWSETARSRKAPRQGSGKDRSPSGPKTGDRPAELTFEELIGWIRIDDEIREPSQDRFGHDTIARRIVRRILPEENEGTSASEPSIAVVGPRGSGKTSIGNFVRWHLEQQGLLGSSILFVPVSLWPFETSRAAVRGILRALVDALAGHVDTTGLATLPAHYAEAITRSGGWLSALGSLLHRECSPDEVLGRVETIARALDLRIVLWVEDLERFTAAPTAGSAGETGHGEERLGPIRSLLHLLDRKDRITVILVAETLDDRFDMNKLARFIERVPRLDRTGGAEVIERFRRGCLDGFDDWIDPALTRREKLSGRSPDEEGPFDVLGAKQPTLTDHVVTLCATPRRLKSALRAALDVWEPLVGEIDFDDVLLMSVLRVTEPDVFALVDRHIDILRDGWETHRVVEDQKCPFDQALSRLLSEEPEATRAAAKELLRYIFDDWHIEKNPASILRPQGLAVAGHADYWRRFLAVPDLANDERDQLVLEEMARWERDLTGQLPDLVAQPDRARFVEDLSQYLSHEAVMALFEKVIEDRAQESSHEWPLADSIHHRPPGIVTMRGIFDRVTPSPAILEERLRAVIQRLTPVNLGLIRELMDLFFSDLLNSSTPRLQDELAEALLNLSTEELINTLKEADPDVLFHCVFSIQESQTRPYPFKNWETFASRLLDTLEQSPSVIVPQLVPFLVKEKGGNPIFDEDAATKLFDRNRLRELLLRHPIPKEEVPEAIRERYRTLMAALS